MKSFAEIFFFSPAVAAAAAVFPHEALQREPATVKRPWRSLRSSTGLQGGEEAEPGFEVAPTS